MYLTSQGSEYGWQNWEGGGTFLKEFNHVLTERKKQDESEKPSEATDSFTKDQLRECKDIFFQTKRDLMLQFFGDGSEIVTEIDDEPVGIRLGNVFFLYFGVMRNLLHMACWLSFPYVQELDGTYKKDHEENELLCCFLFKSRSQKLSEYTSNIGETDRFSLTSPKFD
jgi:hypothetical protein